MAMLEHREFACAILIDTKGRFLFQHRDEVPGIVLPGRISLFGGHRENDESFGGCIARELREELSIVIAQDAIEHLGGFEGTDIDRGYGTAHCEFYVVREVPFEKIRVTEGSLLIVESGNWRALGRRLAPFARAALEQFADASNSLKTDRL